MASVKNSMMNRMLGPALLYGNYTWRHFLESIWQLKPEARVQFHEIGRGASISLMAVVGAACGLAAIGLARFVVPAREYAASPREWASERFHESRPARTGFIRRRGRDLPGEKRRSPVCFQIHDEILEVDAGFGHVAAVLLPINT